MSVNINEVFPVKTPEEVGVNPESIQKAIDFITKENKLEIHSFLLLKDGNLITEKYFRENERNTPHVMFSVSKSFTSTAFGMAYDLGKVSDEDYVFDFFPEYKHLCDSEFKKNMKIKHLLQMGVEWDYNKDNAWEIVGDDFNVIKDNLVEYLLSLPITSNPGEVFLYDTSSTYLVSAIFQKIMGIGVHDYLKENLFNHLKIEGTTWKKCPMGIDSGGVGLWICAYDMAKLGQLYLNKGKWKGVQLLSSEYVEKATKKQISNGDSVANPKNDWCQGYGYQFWKCSYEGFRADGMRGQYIMVNTKTNIIMVITGNIEPMQVPIDAFRDFIKLI